LALSLGGRRRIAVSAATAAGSSIRSGSPFSIRERRAFSAPASRMVSRAGMRRCVLVPSVRPSRRPCTRVTCRRARGSGRDGPRDDHSWCPVLVRYPSLEHDLPRGGGRLLRRPFRAVDLPARPGWRPFAVRVADRWRPWFLARSGRDLARSALSALPCRSDPPLERCGHAVACQGPLVPDPSSVCEGRAAPRRPKVGQ
jgi:hypothetical protein